MYVTNGIRGSELTKELGPTKVKHVVRIIKWSNDYDMSVPLYTEKFSFSPTIILHPLLVGFSSFIHEVMCYLKTVSVPV